MNTFLGNEGKVKLFGIFLIAFLVLGLGVLSGSGVSAEGEEAVVVAEEATVTEEASAPTEPVTDTEVVSDITAEGGTPQDAVATEVSEPVIEESTDSVFNPQDVWEAVEETLTTEEAPVVVEETPVVEETVVEEVAPTEEVTVTEEVTEPVVEETALPTIEDVGTPTESVGAELSTDKDDYHPGETATIFGKFFSSLQNIVLKIFGSDDNDENYTETVIDITTSGSGEFTTDYTLDDLYRPFYEVVATDLFGNVLAETWFRDMAIGTYDQCSNDDGDGYSTGGDQGCRWVNGNLQSNNSTYFEGDSTVQRLELKGLVPGASHTLTLKYGTTKGAKHAYDFLTTWNVSENWISEADLCDGVTTGCNTADEDTFQIPTDTNAKGFDEDNDPRVMRLKGGDITDVTTPTLVSGVYGGGDSETALDIVFNVGPDDGDMCSTKQGVTSCSVVLVFGAHIAKGDDWTGPGGDGFTGATGIPGSPYHVSLDAIDGDAVGERDNQMQSGAIATPQGTISGIKFNDVNNSASFDGGDVPLENWDITLLPDNITVQTGADGTYSFANLPDGVYTVCETQEVGWTQTFPTTDPGDCADGNGYSVTITSGVNVPSGSLDFGNTQLAHLTLLKTVVSDNGGNAADTAWTLAFDGTVNDGSGTEGQAVITNAAVLAGTYALSESNGPAGYTQTNLECTGGTLNGNDVTIAAGASATCTFTNDDIAPTLKLVKVVTNDNGGTAVANSWDLVATGTGGFTELTPALADATASNVNAGTNYTLSETGPAGYNASAWSCTDGDNDGTVNLALDEDVVCTITNNDIPPQLHLRKVVTNDNGGDADGTDWTLTANGAGSNDLSGSTPVDSGAGLLADTWALSESGPAGYSASDWVCVGGTQDGANITVGIGGEATCTITNDDISPTLTIVKNTVGGNAQFDYTVTGPTGSTPSITTIGGTGSVGPTDVDAGEYSVEETIPAGWALTSASCNDGSSSFLVDTVSGIEIALDQDVTCTFTNNKPAAKIDVSPLTATNKIGDDHVITATVQTHNGDGNYVSADDGTLVTFSLLNDTANTSFVGGNTCLTSGGSCSVTINSDQTGSVDIHASADPVELGVAVHVETDGLGENSADGQKTYVNARISIGETATNPVNQAHEFTVTVENDLGDGSGFVALEGALVDVVVTPEPDGGLVETDCNNGAAADGTCTATINSSAPGVFTAIARSQIVVDGVTFKLQTNGVGENSAPAVKTYEGAKIVVEKVTVGGEADFDFTASYDINGFTLGGGDSDESAYLPLATGYSVTETPVAGWYLTSATCDNNNDPSNITLDLNEEVVTCTFTNVKILDLEVEKTAETTYTRTYEWTIDKSVTPATWDLFKGDTGTSEYTVAVTKDDGTPSDHAVSGTITITNPNTDPDLVAIIESVDDVVTNSGIMSVDCGDTDFPYELAAEGELVCTYSGDLVDGLEDINTATVTTSGLVPGGEGTAPVTFGEPTTLVNDEINVTDTVEGDLGETAISTTFEYNNEFVCGSEEGQYEGTGNEIPNTATIEETDQSDDALVTVNCYGLTVTKDASTSLTRTWTWTIEKTGDQTELTLSPGQEEIVNYDVTVDATSQDSAWAVTGSITVNNPAPIPANLSGVADEISVGIDATVNCPALVVPANGSLVCTYSSALINAEDRTNTATATLTNGTDFSGNTDVSFANATVTEVDESIDLTDSEYGDLGTVNAADAPKTFEYSLDIGPYEVEACGTTEDFVNTATFTTNDTETNGDDDHTVTVRVACVCSLTQGYWKTHNDSFQGGAPEDLNWFNLGVGGENTIFFLSGTTWFNVFWTAPKGNAYYNLAHQYMAAKLNVLNGAAAPAQVASALSSAETFFNTFTPTNWPKNQKNNLTNWAGVLGAFNEGTTNPSGHCTEIPI